MKRERWVQRIGVTVFISVACVLCSVATAQTAQAGKALFAQTCAACHQAEGKGTPGLAPALAGTLASLLKSDDGKAYLSQVLVHGLTGRIVSQGQTFSGAMPAQANLSDADLAEVANYLAGELNGIEASTFASGDFQRARGSKPTHKDLRELRSRLMP